MPLFMEFSQESALEKRTPLPYGMLLDVANRLGTAALSSLWSAAALASPDDLGTRPLPASAFDDLHERGFAVVADWLPAKSTAALLEEALELEGLYTISSLLQSISK